MEGETVQAVPSVVIVFLFILIQFLNVSQKVAAFTAGMPTLLGLAYATHTS